METQSKSKYTSISELQARFSHMSYATIKRLVAGGHFPAPVRHTPTSPRYWITDELDLYEQKLQESRHVEAA